MGFTNNEIELIKKAEKYVNASKITRQRVAVTQLQFRTGNICDQ